jgi:hypothetical protein
MVESCVERSAPVLQDYPVLLHPVVPGSSHESAGFAGKNVEDLGEIPCAGCAGVPVNPAAILSGSERECNLISRL